MNVAEVFVAQWPFPDGAVAVPQPGGLINRTWRVEHEGAPLAVVQQLNEAVFRPSVHHDIEAITSRLAAVGVPTPRLVPTRSGGLWATGPEGEVLRALTWVGDRTIDQVEHPPDAEEAAALVARVHAAVADFSWSFHHVRPGAHDTERHVAALEAAVAGHRAHRLFDDVAPLAAELVDRWRSWRGHTDLPSRIIHGDLKLSNIRFTGRRATALVDLDTFQRGTLQTELGDAMRSWCNRAPEDASEASIDADVFEAAMRGYAVGTAEAGGAVTDDEWASVVPGWERIALELAARFAADALEERYFGFDPRFGTRGDHNLLRARGQLSLGRAVRGRRVDLEARVDAARSRT